MSQLFLPSSPEPDHASSYSQGLDSTLMFAASTSHVAHIADLLNTVTSINTHALMVISDSGIVVFTEYNHITNIHLTIDSSLFSSYSLESGLPDSEAPKEMRLGVDISLVADSFTAAAATLAPKLKGSAPSGPESVVCYMKYAGEGYPLIVEFEDRLMSEKIEFATFYLDMEYPYDTSEVSGFELLVRHDRVEFESIVKSDLLTVLLQDLQHINTESLYIYVSNNKRNPGNKSTANQLNFISSGAMGYSKLLFPSAKTMMEKLEIYRQENGKMEPSEGSVLSCFSFAPFSKILKGVKLSSKCKIMKDVSGILSLQLLCKHAGVPNYPGSLITFNIIEKALVGDEFEQPNAIDINAVFDDNHYHYIEDYDQYTKADLREPVRPVHSVAPEAREVEPQGGPSGTLSYASFKIPKTTTHEPPSKRQRQQEPTGRGDDDDDNPNVSVNGPVEIPIFL
ncbi:hypothetical protein CJI97_003611 [Candidozyma auris]|nr:hypothetical protein CJI97_003611 [[Candida] auris]